MNGIFSIFPFSLIDWAWCLELFTLSLSWVILAYGSKRGLRDMFLAGSAFVLLFIMLNVVNLSTVYLAQLLGFSSFYPTIRVLIQGVVTYVFMQRIPHGRTQTKTVLWLVMTTASLSIYAIAGQSSFWAGAHFGTGLPEGITRVAVYLMLIGAAFWLRHYRFDDYRTIPAGGYLLVCVDVACVLILYIIESRMFSVSGEANDAYTIAMLAGYCVTLVIGLTAIHSLYTMCRGQQKLLDLQAEKQRFISEQEQTRMTEAMLHNLRSIRHDLKNQYAYMQILLNEKRYAELESYFTELLKAIPAPLQMVDCGNHTVNTVLNMEFAKLRADNIGFSQQLAVPPVLPFKSEDICAILSNIIDNAADECRRLKQDGKKAEMRLDIHPHQSYLFIQCSNDTDRTELKHNRRGLRTTKQDAELHGYGTQIIARLSEKYNGVCDFHLEGGQFIAQVMLDMEAGDKE